MNHLPYSCHRLRSGWHLDQPRQGGYPEDPRSAAPGCKPRVPLSSLLQVAPTYGIEPVAECLELDKRGGYILSYNGGNIVNAKTGEKLFSQFLPDEVIPKLYGYAKENGHALLGYAGNEIITEMPDDQYVKEESRINKMNIRKVENLFEALEPHPTKLLMTGDPADMLKAEEELVERSWETEWISSARLHFFLELVPKGIDKAKSLTPSLSENQSHPSRHDCFRRWLQRPEHAETCRHGCSHAECSTRGQGRSRLHHAFQ